ncbi:molybdenum cofactor guanylyltransferase [Mycolicibacterium sp.]|uniref:molybdenum cofactor guanylyltransferase n=1 Tax=Mycolicibacterium sp. TaxID=2320850 RepID=UPI0028AE1BB5|nr:molybdenum cofactor guanylyltransferase [Mycolicibacterium sp.]
MPSRDALAAVVLAGGRSRRMGRDKATMPHPTAGVTMVEHTVGVLSQRCARIFVVAAPGQPLPPLDAEILHDEVRGAGPLPATGLGLRAAQAAGLDRAFVSAVDMPNLSIELVDELAADTGVDVVLPWDGRDHYLAGVYRTALGDRIEQLVSAGERSMRALTGAVVTQRVVVTQIGALTNLNEPSDLR